MPVIISRNDLVDIHSLKVDQILCSNLSPEQVIRIVQDFHVENDLIGVIETDVEFLRFDESYFLDFEGFSFKGRGLWKVLVYFGANVDNKRGIFRSHYKLYVDDEKGEVVFYWYNNLFAGIFREGFLNRVFEVSNRCKRWYAYPMYLKKSDYKDFENIDKLRVLDEFREGFLKEYPYY